MGHPPAHREPAPAFSRSERLHFDARGDDGLASTSANEVTASHARCVARALASRENRTGRSLAAPSGSSSSRWRCSPEAHPRLIWRPRPRTSRASRGRRAEGSRRRSRQARARARSSRRRRRRFRPWPTRAGLPPPASRAVTARERLPSEHSREFLAWARRYDKLLEYCPDGAVPCAESLRREAVWRINARHIEEHNRRSGASQPPTRETPSRKSKSKSKTKTKTTAKTKSKAEPHRPLPAHE